MARKIEIVVGTDVRNAEKGFKSLSRSASVSVGSLAKLAIGVASVSAAIAGVNKAVRSGISEFSEQQKVAAQTAAAIKSTGQVAGVTKQQIDELGLSLSNLSGIDDEVVKAGANVLLSFTNIRNAAGRGNDIFSQATKAATDFAARTGKQVPAAALLLGKALQDPASKLSSLARAGVVFTKQQIAQVAAIQKTKGVMEAQKVVLAAFAQRFGGAARALGQTLPGQLAVIRERLRDAVGDLVGLVAPAFTRVARSAADFVKRFSQAQTLRAKFKVVVDGISGVGRQILTQLEDQIGRIDVRAVVDELQSRLVSALNRIGSFLSRVDYGAIGRALGDGLVRGAQGAAQFLQSVDWSVVGGAIVNGIRDFLTAVNWKALAVAVVTLIVVAFRATFQLVRGIGVALGQALIDGLQAIGARLEKLATLLALKIIEPFSHIPKLLGGGAFQGIKDALQARLDEMEAAAKKTASVIGDTFGITKLDSAGAKKAAKTPAARATAAAIPVPSVSAVAPAVAAASKAEALLARRVLAEQRAEAARAAVQSRQFRAIGLAGDGGEVIPGVANLKKQLESLTARLGPSVSTKLKGQLGGVRKVLLGEFGAITRDSRKGVAGIFDAIRGEFDKGAKGPLTKGSGLDTKKVVAGLGLSASQINEIRGRISGANSSGLALAGGGTGAGFVGGRGTIVESHVTVQLDGHTVGKTVTRSQQKTKRRNPPQRRGPNRGGV